MRDNLDKLLAENAEKSKPKLNISIDRVTVHVEVGQSFEGMFTINNDMNTSIRGKVFSSIANINFDKDYFDGTEVNIQYSILVSSYTMKEKITGEISVVSNAGTYKIPVDIYIKPKAISTESSSIKDLEQFISLAKHNWKEAVEVFFNEDFKNILLFGDREKKLLYEYARDNTSGNQALEDFLISINAKQPVVLRIITKDVEQIITNRRAKNTLTIERSTWGYIMGNVYSDVDFVEISQHYFDSDDFVGNRLDLECYFEPKKMHLGNNKANIIIETFSNTLSYEIQCMKKNVLGVDIDKLSYRLDEDIKLNVSNSTGEKVNLIIEDSDKVLLLDGKQFSISSAETITLKLDYKSKNLLSAAVAAGKRLTMPIRFAILIKTAGAQNTLLRKEFIINIALQSII